jgi:hypothetical protein
LGSLNFSIAQESSPTKEVTVQSINKYMNEAVGMKYYTVDDSGETRKRIDEYLIETNNFSLDEILKKTLVMNYERETGKYQGTSYSAITFSQLNWENITIKIDSSESLFRESSLALITIYPTTKVKFHFISSPGTFNTHGDQTSYWSDFSFYIPKNRVTSCHKALLHLKELMKEEDPFGN